MGKEAKVKAATKAARTGKNPYVAADAILGDSAPRTLRRIVKRAFPATRTIPWSRGNL